MNSTNAFDATTRKRIYVGGLHLDTTEDLLLTLFGQFGNIMTCKLLEDTNGPSNKYAFIDFEEHKDASMAVGAMDKRVCLGKTIKVNWANNTSEEGDVNISPKDFAIFVGDISDVVTESELLSAFSKFGVISSCRIVRDPTTFKCKNFGFIYFREKEAAETAIKSMNGYWIGNRSIRTNWAQRRITQTNSNGQKRTYQQVANLASPANSTVFCGNFQSGLTESLLQSMFSRFGSISTIRVFVDKGYGFVTFADKSSAVRAILAMDSFVTNEGSVIKVSWGKERGVQQNTEMNFQGMQNYESDPAYLQYCQQQAYAMFMQQHNFYQANTMTSQSPSCPFYGSPLFQASSVSESRMQSYKQHNGWSN